MTDNGKPGRQLFLRLQSAYVLPLARAIYLLIAIACLVAVIGGAIYAAYLQASVSTPPALTPLPPPFQGSHVAPGTSVASMDLAAIGTRLAVPTNVRFVVTVGTITALPAQNAVLGHFVADTPNRLAPFPEGVSILGGRDAALFERVQDPTQQAVALVPRAALLDDIREQLRDLKSMTTRSFEIRVVARDRHGITSAPADLAFDLRFAPAPAATAETKLEPTMEHMPAPTELQKIAREIARIVEPTVNPAHFSAYQAAVKVPSRCGTHDADDRFVASYRRALDELRPQLAAANVEAFYAGLCDAWKDVMRREAAERERAEQALQAERRSAEIERMRVQAQNDEVLRSYATRLAQAKVETQLTLSVVGGAAAVFLSVALILAFLAIEGHSRAVRAAMESMVRITQEQSGKGTTQGTL